MLLVRSNQPGSVNATHPPLTYFCTTFIAALCLVQDDFTNNKEIYIVSLLILITAFLVDSWTVVRSSAFRGPRTVHTPPARTTTVMVTLFIVFAFAVSVITRATIFSSHALNTINYSS